MKRSPHEKSDVLKLPNDEETVEKVFMILNGNTDFGKALSKDGLHKVLEALKEFFDRTDPDQHHQFVVQITTGGEKGSENFGWMAFHWHRIYGENESEWNVQLPPTLTAENGIFPGTGPNQLGLENVYGFEDGADVTLGWEDLDPEFMLAQLEEFNKI